jgi:aryl-alcohol dehydrogenase-like predicted oxidoreductase
MAVADDIPSIGLGTWQTFDVDRSRYAERRAVLGEFVGLGGRLVDTSPMYGRAEETLGAVREAADPEGRLFLATKVWTRGRDAGITQMTESLRRLRTERIDLMQVHNLVDVHTHLATLRDWQAAGRVRHIGVTHYTASAHAEVERILQTEPVEFLQINYSVAEPDADRRLLPLAQDKNIRVIVNRPFAEGALLRRLRTRPVPPWAREIGCQGWSQLLLIWVLSHPAVACVIPATSSLDHLRDNMAALGSPRVDEAVRRKISGAYAAI